MRFGHAWHLLGQQLLELAVLARGALQTPAWDTSIPQVVRHSLAEPPCFVCRPPAY